MGFRAPGPAPGIAGIGGVNQQIKGVSITPSLTLPKRKGEGRKEGRGEINEPGADAVADAMLLGTAASHVRVFRFKFQLRFSSSFPLRLISST